jgi:four helix bundle protein
LSSLRTLRALREKNFSIFCSIAKGSLAELQTQLEIAFAIGYIDEATFRQLDEK